jgi:hypothetical protein
MVDKAPGGTVQMKNGASKRVIRRVGLPDTETVAAEKVVTDSR